MKDPIKDRLISLIRKVSYREGDFTLASGKKSRFYIDLKATTLHPEGADLIGKLAVQELSRKGWTIDAVGGLTLGADPIATAVSLAAWSQGMSWPAFIVRKEPKAHGTSRYIEGVENLRPGASVVVLEDVVTTGGSSLKAVERLKESGFEPLGVLSVVDREEGGREIFEQKSLELISLVTVSELRQRSG